MSTWTHTFDRNNKWHIVKEGRAYVLSCTSQTNGLKAVMTQQPKKVPRSGGIGTCVGGKKKAQKTGSGSCRGQKVIARDDSDGLYYSGCVEQKINGTHTMVEFDHGKKQMTDNYSLIPVGGAVSRPHIRTADYVLVQVQNRHTGRVCFIPGIVEMMPRRMNEQARFYSVLLYNSQMATTMRCHLTKITKTRFEILCKFLLDKDLLINRLNPDRKHSRHSKSVHESPENPKYSRSRSYSLSSRSNSTSYSDLKTDNIRQNKSRSKSRSRSVSPPTSVYSSRSNSPKHLATRSRSLSTSETSIQKGVEDKSTNTPAITLEEVDKDKEIIESQQKQLSELQAKLVKQQSIYTHNQKKLRKLKKKLKNKNEELSKSGNSGFIIPKIAMNDIEISTSDLDTSNDKTSSLTDIPPHIRALRQTLAPLTRGTVVIARWSTEGWYYRGIIEACHFDESYHIRDSAGNIERVYREDVLAPTGGVITKKIEIGDSVIAPHPRYAHSHVPAKVTKTRSHDHTIRVELYDGQEIAVRRNDLLPLTNKKYDYDVEYIRRCEDRLIGEVVIARDDNSGTFQIDVRNVITGQVRQKLGRDARYVVKFAEGQNVIQYATYIYSANNKRHELAPGDRLLALANPNTCTYLPGRVSSANESGLNVTFCDQTSRSDIQSCQSFWLSPNYYDDLVEFYTRIKESRQD